MFNTRFLALPVLFGVAMGVLVLLRVLDNPRLAGARGPDLLQLIAVGFCFGGAFGMIIATFALRRRSAQAGDGGRRDR